MTTTQVAPFQQGDSQPLANYRPATGVYDEMMAADGSVRPEWQPVVQWFSDTSLKSQAGDARKLQRLIFDNFGDPLRNRNMWRLDLAPLVIDAKTWALIETAAKQRARLYNALLRDLYGDQTVFSKGLLTPQLILSDTGFLRPMCGVAVPKGHLTFLALDFARDVSGQWRIIDAHTETPAGHGFALANRMVTTDVLGQTFRATQTLRIAPFYQSLTDDLLARAGTDNPLLAVLVPKPESSAFVGHSYMARYMGHMRVQGSDLRIVGNAVYLKTISGLKKIDLLIRAIEGHRADPLELTPDGFDGPVGLVEACRQNADIVVNALGTAVVENRGLSCSLPALAQHLIGEEVIIADTPRHWLGDPHAKAAVMSELDAYLIHDAREGPGSPGEAAPGRHMQSLAPEGQQKLLADIEHHGQHLVAEKPAGFATAPAWSDTGLHPEPFAIRVFVAAINGDFTVMPGGLALSVDAESTVALSSSRSQSRDVWVVGSDAAVPHQINLKRLAAQHHHVQRNARALHSSAADNLFWLGRYCERADGTLRLIRQTLKRSHADMAVLPSSHRPLMQLQALLAEAAPPRKLSAKAPPQAQSICDCLEQLCVSPENPIGLMQTLRNIQQIAGQCRDLLSEDAWHALNGFDPGALSRMAPVRKFEDAANPEPLQLPENARDIIEQIDALLLRFAAFAGLSHENMTRNSGRLFLDLGRRVERAKRLSDLLLCLFGKSEDTDLESDDILFALETADSYITFRSRYRFAPVLSAVLDLLIVDRTNPRSLAYQLTVLSEHIDKLPKSANDAVRASDQRLALEVLNAVSLANAEELALANETGEREALTSLLQTVSTNLPKLCDLLSRNYFSLADEAPRRLRATGPA